MHAYRQVIVAVVAALVVPAWLFAWVATESVAAASGTVGLTLVAVWVHAVLHEGGHLVAALALRLPVAAVRIVPFTGTRNAVVVRPAPHARALRSRMVLLHLAGPTTNLVTATAVGVAAADAVAARSSASTSLTLLGTAVTAALVGLANLVPGERTDGGRILRWLSAPADARRTMSACCHEAVNTATRAVIAELPAADGPDDEARQALAAFQRRWCTGHPGSSEGLVADAERLVALAADADPAVAATIRRAVTVWFGLWYLHTAVIVGEPVAHKEVVEVADLARLAADAEPRALSSRLALGLTHLLDERPDQARAVLADIRPGADPAGLPRLALLLRAIAGYLLGDRGDADRDLEAVGRRYEALAHCAAVVRAADPTPPMFAPTTATVAG